VHPTIPDTGSAPENATVSGRVCQPRTSGFDVGSPVTAGPVVSIFTVTLACAPRPAVLVTLHVSVCPAVSLLMAVVSQPDDVATPDSGSATVHAIVTAPVNQPFVPAGPETCGVISGGVVSGSAT
jgi:hypothetical protein